MGRPLCIFLHAWNVEGGEPRDPGGTMSGVHTCPFTRGASLARFSSRLLLASPQRLVVSVVSQKLHQSQTRDVDMLREHRSLVCYPEYHWWRRRQEKEDLNTEQSWSGIRPGCFDGTSLVVTMPSLTGHQLICRHTLPNARSRSEETSTYRGLKDSATTSRDWWTNKRLYIYTWAVPEKEA